MKRNDYIKKHAIDAEWFLELKAIRTPLLLQSYRIEAAILADQFNQFITNPNQNPTPHYPNLDKERIVTCLAELDLLREKIVQDTTKKSIHSIYLEKLTLIEKELRLQLASIENDWSVFAQLNKELYGRLDPDICVDVAAKLEKRFGMFPGVTLSNDRLSELRARARQADVSVVERLLSTHQLEAENDRLYEAKEIALLWDRALLEHAPGWRTEQSSEVIHFKVNNRRRKVYIPENVQVRGDRLKRLYAHEVGVHVRRREMGKRSVFQLMSIGLPGYETIEEGVAIMMEQVTAGRFYNFGGHDKYLALMIATGAVDGEKRDFKDTFVLLQSYFKARSLKRHKEERAEQIANERAWRMCWRIFRGGNPSIPGCCFMKDKMYREGNVLAWRTLLDNPQLLSTFYAGKFDPLREDQVELINSVA